MTTIAVVGAGLAGSECAWALAEHWGLQVTLFEMKREKPTPAQHEPQHFAELVCSNSLKSKSRLNPAGVLKHEMDALGSLILPWARKAEVPAGETLAVDRAIFSGGITQALRSHPRIQVRDVEVADVDALLAQGFDAVVVATGPLTSDALSASLKRLTESESLYFYDAIAPIIDGSSIDESQGFWANRATRTQAFEAKERADALSAGVASLSEEALGAAPGLSTQADLEGLPPLPAEDCDAEAPGDYFNLPLSKDAYFAFVDALLAAPKAPFHEFEEPRYFNGCQPIERLAESGRKTLAFGPMKPRGLTDPRTGREAYACVQLRRETVGDAAFNMVGFQTRLTWGAQRELFRTLPALAEAEFFRLGSMHRNTYLVSPRILGSDYSLKARPGKVWLAGQVMGVEGYLESAAMGIFMGHLLGARFATGTALPPPPPESCLGALCRYVLACDPKHFTPMNIHWGLFDAPETESAGPTPLTGKKRPKPDKTARRLALAERSEARFGEWLRDYYERLHFSNRK